MHKRKAHKPSLTPAILKQRARFLEINLVILVGVISSLICLEAANGDEAATKKFLNQTLPTKLKEEAIESSRMLLYDGDTYHLASSDDSAKGFSDPPKYIAYSFKDFKVLVYKHGVYYNLPNEAIVFIPMGRIKKISWEFRNGILQCNITM